MSANPRLDAAYATQAKAIRARVQAFTKARFGSVAGSGHVAGQYRDADLARFVSQASSVVLAGRAQTAALTDAYLTQVLRSAGLTVPAHKAVDTAALRGVDVADVLARPYATVWTGLGNGDTFGDAVSAGEARLGSIVATDMQMAKVATAQNVLSAVQNVLSNATRSTSTTGSRVSGYARVPSGDNTCALCEIASTQRYHVEDLLPIHPGCGCNVDVLTDNNPWDQAAADKRLEDTHAAVFDRLGVSDSGGRDVGLGKVDSNGKPISDYTALVAVRDHGEIGPVLVRAGDHFTGPNGLK